MTAPPRSPVPDLLFEDEQERRLADLEGLLETPEAVRAETPLHRLTVFLTYRCNLDCPYCKTIARSEAELAARPQKRKTYDLAAFDALLAQHRGTPLRHLHFTGGEATLLPTLAEMARRAKAAGVERLSVTSNGTLPAERYLGLVAAGLDELRLSIDAVEPTLGAVLTGRRDAWARSMATLEALGQARRAGTPFFLVVNTVVTATNRAQLPAMVERFVALGVDDVKLITEVDERGRLADFPERAAVCAALEALLAAQPAARFPLLRRKLRTVFAPDAIGLEGVRDPGDWRCFIPLTERTVDGSFYYPCSVYLREGGAPLGALTDDPATQREKSARFVREGNCLADPICRRYCLHCTRSWNERANGARR